MERDVEMQLSTAIASMQATLTGFAKDVTRRFDEQGERLDQIHAQVQATNGRVTVLETINHERGAQKQVRVGRAERVEIGDNAPLRLSQLKLLVAVAIGSAAMAIGCVLWVLEVVGKL